MMYVTEEEAKTKWCPMARVTVKGTDAPSFNSLADDDALFGSPVSQCIGSVCMMWRWYDPEQDIQRPQRQGLGRGFCGLAGEPK